MHRRAESVASYLLHEPANATARQLYTTRLPYPLCKEDMQEEAQPSRTERNDYRFHLAGGGQRVAVQGLSVIVLMSSCGAIKR